MKSLVPWWMHEEGGFPPSTSEYRISLILFLPLETGAQALNWSIAPGTRKSVNKLAFVACLLAHTLECYSFIHPPLPLATTGQTTVTFILNSP